MIEYRPLKIALLGAGSVGCQVAKILLEQKDELAKRVGAELELVGVLVRDKAAKRDHNIPEHLLTTAPDPLILGADIVIELLGGIEPARTYILQALNSGSDVITANKALLASSGAELYDAAEQVGAQLYFEAAVAAAIPIIRPLRESLAGDSVKRIMGIVNGSTNYILDRMNSTGCSLKEAIAEADLLSYLEADPTLDLEGYDAAQKAAILASLAFHTEVPIERVYREGITSITKEQVAAAKRDGYAIKLLAICEKISAEGEDPEGISVRVYPAMIPNEHPLASVHGAFNAVFVEAEAAGSLMFYGSGAGGLQTASAVMGDLVSAAKRHIAGGPGLADSVHANLPVLPGVLANIANIFAQHNVSIEMVEQSSRMIQAESTAWLEIGTHMATDQSLAEVVEALKSNPAVEQVTSVIRVEGE